MAKEEFDLGEIQELKMNAYVKAYCKPAMVKKGKNVLLLNKLDLKGAKKSFIAIFFNKPTDGQKAFKKLKKDGLHLMKHTALATVAHGVGDDGKPEVTLDVVKGALALDTIQTEGQSLFNNDIGMGLKVIGASDDGSGSSETSTTDDKTKKEEKQDKNAQARAAKRAKRAEKHDKMLEGIAKLNSVKDKAPKEKLEANIQKYETALAALVKEANADGVVDAEEQAKIDELTKALADLKTAVENGGGEKKGKKLSVEERAKITENIGKIDEKLKKIMAKLKMDV